MHTDIIDGGTNSFISAFYVTSAYRGRGVGSLLLEEAIKDSLASGAVGLETSTIHAAAKRLYERHHFKQTIGDFGYVFLELDIDEYSKSKKRPYDRTLRS
jgi:ribosomal protein S18 acetylase RimI-like enzyme